MFDNEFGNIEVCVRAGMRRVTARWRNGSLHINIPPGFPPRLLSEFIESNREGLRSLRERTLKNTPKPIEYRVGQRIPCFRGEVLIATLNCKARTTGYRREENGNLTVFISSLDDIATEAKTIAISGALKELMKRTAPHVLLPFAHEVAREIGVSPKEFIIGRGIRKLGHCTNKGVIQLSYMLMFLPEELVRYIICHELAHLSEMNHSPRFHALCNTYCNGKEKALEKLLKGFNFPILKNS